MKKDFEKKLLKKSTKIWKLKRISYLCTPNKNSSLDRWYEYQKSEKLLKRIRKKSEKKERKIWKFKINSYLCTPLEITETKFKQDL